MDWYLTGFRKPSTRKMIRNTGYTGGIFFIRPQVFWRAFENPFVEVAEDVVIRSAP